MFGLSPLVLWATGLVLVLAAIFSGFQVGSTTGWSLTFLFVAAFRYVRLVVNVVAFLRFKGRPLFPTPTFSPEDVAVVIPTKFSNPPEHIQCIRRILACAPSQVIVVTANPKAQDVYKLLADADLLSQVTLMSVERFDKKLQMVAALKGVVQSPICCFADDDVQWPSPAFLPTMLASFEDEKVGASGPSQRVRRDANCWGILPTFWNFLGIGYLERRNFNTGATNHMDGAVSTLSGRTSFYRTNIIQNDRFYDYFLNSANHDDDKNLTRWTFVQGWEIALQFHPDALIETTLETDFMGFMGQCLRWCRGHFRGNFRVMGSCTYWYEQHTWSLYAIYIGQFQTPALLWDSFMIYSLAMAMAESQSRFTALSAFFCWILFTKVVKLIPHFCRHPQDMIYIPGMIIFSWVHGFINVYALLTLDNKGWGARKA